MAVFLLLSAYFLIYADRKVWAAVQMRRGPNVVGAFGLLQSGADMLKLVFKEIIIPAGADKPVFFLAPLISFVMAILAWAVIPLNEGWVLSEINVALLFVFAISSLEVYVVIMGVLASVIGAFYYLKIVYLIYFGDMPESPLDNSQTPILKTIWTASAAIMVFGVISLFGIEDMAKAAASSLLN